MVSIVSVLLYVVIDFVADNWLATRKGAVNGSSHTRCQYMSVTVLMVSLNGIELSRSRVNRTRETPSVQSRLPVSLHHLMWCNPQERPYSWAA